MEILASLQLGLTWLIMAIGAMFIVVGAIGLIKFPDFYTRVHAAGLTDTMGAGMILLALMVQAGFSLATLKLFLILAFLEITCPTITHALMQAALHNRLQPKLAPDDNGEGN